MRRVLWRICLLTLSFAVSQNLITLFAGGRVGRVSASCFSLLLVPPAAAWIVFPLVFAVEVKSL
jgi:hypothetical protein